jgi:hypothetical protein
MSLFLQNRYLIISVVALVCFAVGQWVEHQFAQLALVSHLLFEVAYALVIALAISVGIEAASRRELESTVRSELEQHAATLLDINAQLTKTVEAVGHDVYHAIFKRRIPEAILDEIELGILRSDFARTDHNAVYHLNIISASQLHSKVLCPHVMSIKAWTTYKVKNIAHATRDYPIRIFLDKTGSQELSKYIEVRQVKVNGEIIPASLADVEETEKHKRYLFQVKAVPPGNEIEVESNIEYIKYVDDYELWTSAIASDGMKLAIHFPSEVKQWDVFSIHRCPLKTLTKHATFGSFEIEHAVLPHQGMAIWWRCSDDQPQKSAPASAELTSAPQNE